MSFNHNKMDSNQFCRSVIPKLLIITANVIKHFLCARHYFKHLTCLIFSPHHSAVRWGLFLVPILQVRKLTERHHWPEVTHESGLEFKPRKSDSGAPLLTQYTHCQDSTSLIPVRCIYSPETLYRISSNLQ